jgi:hypothetical protein
MDLLPGATGLLAIEWDPDITGYMAFGIGVLVLCGSVYLLLATNLGARLGFLVAWTGLWGWMFLMGIVWWVFAIGWVGAVPTWDVVQITDDLSTSTVDEIRELGTIQPDEEPPEDWVVVPDSEKGEADSVADTVLPEALGVSSTLDYRKFRVLETGGERSRPVGIPNNVLTRFLIPSRGTPHYAIVQAQVYLPAEPVDLNTDEVVERELDTSQGVVNVVLIRDQGDKRLPPAMVTLLSGALFFLGAWLLHRRDKLEEAIRSQPTG